MAAIRQDANRNRHRCLSAPEGLRHIGPHSDLNDFFSCNQTPARSE